MSEPYPPQGTGPDTGMAPHCYRHVHRETYVSCQRCGRPICPDCMRQASVGFHCPECVREAQATVPRARTRFGGRSAGPTPVVTISLVAINVAVFILIYATNGLNGTIGKRLVEIPSSAVYDPRANFEGIAQGAYWQLITSTFAHTEILHIAMNMFALWIFGVLLERVLGRWRFLVLYLVSGFVGSVAVYLLAAPYGASLGASGAVFGLFAAAFVVLLKAHQNVNQLLILLVVNLVISFTVPNIAWQAHIGGLLTGAAIGAAYAYAPRSQRTLIHIGLPLALLAVGIVAVILRTASLTA